MNMAHREKPGGTMFVERPTEDAPDDIDCFAAEERDSVAWEVTTEGYLIIRESGADVERQTVYAPGHWTKLEATEPKS